MGVVETFEDIGDTFLGKNKYRASDVTLQVDPADQQRQLELRGQQGQYNQWLQNAMAGKGPTVAQTQMAQGQQRAIAGAASNAASARGGNVALANRVQGQQLATGLQRANADAAMLRASEQQAYAKQFGDTTNQQRMADLQARGLSVDEAKAQMDAELRKQEINAKITEGNATRGAAGAGGLVTSAGAAIGTLAMSDIKSKENVRPMYSDFAMKEEGPSFAQRLSTVLTNYGQPLAGQIDAQSQLNEAHQRREEEYAREQQEREAAAQQQPKQEKSGGILGGLLSDAKTKELKHENNQLKSTLAKQFVMDRPQMVAAADAPSPGRYSTSPHEDYATMVAYDPANADQGSQYMTRAGAPGQAQQYAVARPEEVQGQGFTPVAPTSAPMVSDYTQKELGGLGGSRGGELGGLSHTEPEKPKAKGKKKDEESSLWEQFKRYMLSDFSAKESRRDLAPIRPVNYRYKPEAAARMALETGSTPEEERMVYADKRSPRNGIIAQDLEKSPAFDDSVIETPAGKAIDRDRALSEALAQMAMLDKRLRQVEGPKRGAR